MNPNSVEFQDRRLQWPRNRWAALWARLGSQVQVLSKFHTFRHTHLTPDSVTIDRWALNTALFKKIFSLRL